MSTILIGGVATLSALIIGTRLYNAYFVWGTYKDMVDDVVGNTSNRLAGRTVIVTGANSGVGKETTRTLFAHGARVILACRNEPETLQLIDQLIAQYPQSTGELVFRPLDLTSMTSVQSFADRIERDESDLYCLVNNAAVFGAPVDRTVDGFEVNMQVNHLAPALLTLLLLPKLQRSHGLSDRRAAAKVVMVSSTLTKGGRVDLELLAPVDEAKVGRVRDSAQAASKSMYASTKLTNLLFTRRLVATRPDLGAVQVCLASPGFSFTRLHRYASTRKLLAMSLFAPLFAMVLKSSVQGAQTVIGCVMTDSVRSDVLYHNCKPDTRFLTDNASVNDPETAERVYRLTIQTLDRYVPKQQQPTQS